MIYYQMKLKRKVKEHIDRLLIEGEELEFSGGFTDLHTRVYEGILRRKWIWLEDARQAIEIVHTITKLRTNRFKRRLSSICKEKTY